MFNEFTLNSNAKNATHVAEVKKNPKYRGDVLDIIPSKKQNYSNEFTLSKGILQPVYSEMSDAPLRIFICGPSGCGKSTYASWIVEDYKRKHPKNRFIVFSVKEKDPALDKYKPLRILCDEKLIDDPIEVKELHNSLVLFDDIDQFGNQKISKALNQLRDNVMSTGRSEGIACLTTSQVMLDGKRTKNTLTNTHQLFLFGNGGGKYHGFEFLTRYMRMPKVEANKYVNMPSRFVCVNRVVPMFLLTENGCILL